MAGQVQDLGLHSKSTPKRRPTELITKLCKKSPLLGREYHPQLHTMASLIAPQIRRVEDWACKRFSSSKEVTVKSFETYDCNTENGCDAVKRMLAQFDQWQTELGKMEGWQRRQLVERYAREVQGSGPVTTNGGQEIEMRVMARVQMLRRRALKQEWRQEVEREHLLEEEASKRNKRRGVGKECSTGTQPGSNINSGLEAEIDSLCGVWIENRLPPPRAHPCERR